jgi:transposase-like protein
MSKKEFFELVPTITKAYYEKQSSMGLLKFKWRYLFNLKLIKRFLSHWRGYSKEFLLKFKKQIELWFKEKSTEAAREGVSFNAK